MQIQTRSHRGHSGSPHIIVVGSNPSTSSRCKSIKVLNLWLDYISNGYIVSFTNVSIHQTKNNRPLLKNEWELDRLFTEVKSYDKIITLGKTASEALDSLGLDHFKMHHPSPLNRLNNDIAHVYQRLEDCKKYLEE